MSRVPREGKTLNSRSWLVGFKKRVVLLAGGSSHCWISVTELISPQKGVWEKRGWFAREREKQKEGKRMPTGRPGRVAKITHFDGIKMSVFASPIFEDSAPPELYIPPPPPPPPPPFPRPTLVYHPTMCILPLYRASILPYNFFFLRSRNVFLEKLQGLF